jgi:hypothetical protein
VSERVVDFSLPGGILLRVVDASERHLAALDRQLGIAPGSMRDGRAHLTIRFVDNLTVPEPIRWLGDDAAATSAGFHLVRVVGGRRRLVSLPLDQLGAGMTMTCDSAITDVPQLVPLVNVTALANGVLPLHASAAAREGTGLAAAGWSKGGKTEALLALWSAGWTPVADEWCYIEPGGVGMGIPGPVRIQDDHLRQMNILHRHRSTGELARLAVAGALVRAYGHVSPRRWSRARPLHTIHRLVPFVDALRHVDVTASDLFGRPPYRPHRIDRIVLVASVDQPQTVVRSITAAEAVDAMVAAHMHHRLGLLATYRMFRFATPDRPSAVLEDLEKLERRLLAKHVGSTDISIIDHPHPAPIGALQRALLSAVADGR